MASFVAAGRKFSVLYHLVDGAPLFAEIFAGFAHGYKPVGGADVGADNVLQLGKLTLEAVDLVEDLLEDVFGNSSLIFE